MGDGVRAQSLSPGEHQRLEELLAALTNLPTPEVIVEAGRIRCPLPLNDASRSRFRQVISGGIAAQKILAYIEMLRFVNLQRLAVGKANHETQQRAAELMTAEDLAAAGFLVQADRLAGIQEVTWHFFAICVGRIERYLPLVTRPAGYRMSQADKEVLASFRPLRDYYEHLEDHLPAAKSPGDVVEITETPEHITVRMGLTIDDDGRIVLDGKPIDVTAQGLNAVGEVLQRVWNAAGANAIEEVRKHFTRDPSNIPSPDSLSQSLLSRSAPIGPEEAG